MMLENCVYDFFEITTLNMAQQGLFGNITHVKGAYNHCLYDIWPDYNADWRMQYNMAHRGDDTPLMEWVRHASCWTFTGATV